MKIKTSELAPIILAFKRAVKVSFVVTTVMILIMIFVKMVLCGGVPYDIANGKCSGQSQGSPKIDLWKHIQGPTAPEGPRGQF